MGELKRCPGTHMAKFQAANKELDTVDNTNAQSWFLTALIIRPGEYFPWYLK